MDIFHIGFGISDIYIYIHIYYILAILVFLAQRLRLVDSDFFVAAK